jgi:hypothetical protein
MFSMQVNDMIVMETVSLQTIDALTNLFLVRNIRQVMSLKNELCDMKMNDDDNITSYFVRIS